jgi:hypothetical protein
MQIEVPTGRGSRSWLAGLVAGGLAVAGLAGCAHEAGSVSNAPSVDPSRLAGYPADQMTLVTNRQHALDTAIADQDAARQAKDEADKRIKPAESDVNVANADLGQAKEEAKVARKDWDKVQSSGTTDPQTLSTSRSRVESAERRLRDAHARVDAEHAKVDYLRSLDKLADDRLTLADREVDLQRSELQRARLRTLERVNPAEARAMEVHPADFDAAVAERDARVADTRADIARDRADAQTKYHVWETRNEGVEHMKQGAQERAAVPPPPRG